MKAVIKIHVEMSIEDVDAKNLNSFGSGEAHDGEVVTESLRRRFLAYPHHANVDGMRDVTDPDDARRLFDTVKANTQRVFDSLGIREPAPVIVLDSPPPRDPEFMAEAAEKAMNPELRPSFQAKIETVKCSACGDQPVKVVDDDKQCSKCGKVVIPKPQPAPLLKNGANGVAH